MTDLATRGGWTVDMAADLSIRTNKKS